MYNSLEIFINETDIPKVKENVCFIMILVFLIYQAILQNNPVIQNQIPHIDSYPDE